MVFEPKRICNAKYGSYTGLLFDQGLYNMASIPKSRTKWYGQLGDRATQTLRLYFKEILWPTMWDEITRFVLVDHSGSGRSVDSFRHAFLDMVATYRQYEELADQQTVNNAVEYYRAIPMVPINVIDYKRHTSSSRPVINTIPVPVVAEICVGHSSEGYRLLGDNTAHDRVTASYPPAKWEKPR
jgi:hypothetical protein